MSATNQSRGVRHGSGAFTHGLLGVLVSGTYCRGFHRQSACASCKIEFERNDFRCTVWVGLRPNVIRQLQAATQRAERRGPPRTRTPRRQFLPPFGPPDHPSGHFARAGQRRQGRCCGHGRSPAVEPVCKEPLPVCRGAGTLLWSDVRLPTLDRRAVLKEASHETAGLAVHRRRPARVHPAARQDCH